jgi:hypothetical protein
VLGRTTFAARVGDHVTIEGELSRPAYAYLIAFRPDGREELCFPEREDDPPPLTDRPRYPSVSQDLEYGLDEGEGLQVFVLVVSGRSLPPYKEWRTRRPASPWAHEPAPEGVVWHYDGTEIHGLTEDLGGQRGKGKQTAGRTPVVRLADWLRSGGAEGAPVEATAAVGFAVLPKGSP